MFDDTQRRKIHQIGGHHAPHAEHQRHREPYQQAAAQALGGAGACTFFARRQQPITEFGHGVLQPWEFGVGGVIAHHGAVGGEVDRRLHHAGLAFELCLDGGGTAAAMKPFYYQDVFVPLCISRRFGHLGCLEGIA